MILNFQDILNGMVICLSRSKVGIDAYIWFLFNKFQTLTFKQILPFCDCKSLNDCQFFIFNHLTLSDMALNNLKRIVICRWGFLTIQKKNWAICFELGRVINIVVLTANFWKKMNIFQTSITWSNRNLLSSSYKNLSSYSTFRL